jgi:hypothetical protein
MNRGNRKCQKCGLVTWVDYEDCPNCHSAVSKKKRGLGFRIRIYVLIGLGCIAIFSVYRYVHRPLPPTDEELTSTWQGIAESRFTNTGRINRATNELYDVVSIRPGYYQLWNRELSEEDGVYYYSADFSLNTITSQGQSGPGYHGRIKLKQIDGKWKVVSTHVEEPQ